METDSSEPTIVRLNNDQFDKSNEIVEVVRLRAIMFGPLGNGGHADRAQVLAESFERKKGGVKQAKLPEGSPSWEEFSQMTWEQIQNGARANRPGFKVVRKLLTDKRFNR